MKLKRTKFCTKLNAFMHSSVLVAGLALAACGEQSLTQTFLQPYEGEIIKDKNGTYFQANTILLTAKEGVTKSEVERMISPYGGKITGWIKLNNTFVIFLPTDQRERARLELPKNSSVVAADIDYYYRPFSDNDLLSTKDTAKYGCVDWFKTISLTQGLDLLQNRQLAPTVIAVIDVDKFDVKDPQIPYVAEKYHADFTQSPNTIYSADIGDFGRLTGVSEHSTKVATVAAAKNDGKLTNGVAALSNIQVLPLVAGNLQIHPEYVNKPLDVMTELIANHADFQNILAALDYVYNKSDELHIKVVNLSLGGNSEFPPEIHNSLAKLNRKGIIVVAGAGNSNEDAKLFYPSSYEGIIAVGATSYDTNKNKEQRWFSNDKFNEGSNFSTDPKYVTVVAPGNVLVPYRGNIIDKFFGFFIGGERYDCIDATSASTPQVSGLVALMKSLKPDMQYAEAVSRLRAGADPIILDDDPEPTMKGQNWYRINVRKTLATLINDIESTQTVGKCTITTLPSGSHLTNFTGTHIIFGETRADGGVIMRYAPFDSPNSKTDFPGSNIFFDKANVASRDNLVVFGSYTSGIGSKYEHIFRIGQDTIPLVRKDFIWNTAQTTAPIRLFGDTLANGYGINLAILENIQTSTSYNLLKIPDQYLAIGLEYRLIGFYGNRYVSGISLSPTEYKYISYNGSWEQVNLPSNANCFSTNPLYAEKLTCIVGSKSVLIYDFATKTSRTINLAVDYSILDLTLWNNRLAVGLTDDNVAVTDIDGKMIFNSSINNATKRYAAFNQSVYLRDSRIVYELYGLETTPSAVVTCKLE